MVQKEMGDRFKAIPNTKGYNALSVFLQYYYNITEVMVVNRKLFYPVPNVDSVVIKFKQREDLEVNDINFFRKLVKDAFKQKRKLLKNNLVGYNWEKVKLILSDLGYDEKVRAENITVENFVFLSNALTCK